MTNSHMSETYSGAAAKGSSFFAGMRILPSEQRAAMYAIYAFCRVVDDIADGPDPRSVKHAALAEWQRSIMSLYAGFPDERVSSLVGPMRSFDLEKDDFLAVIAGMMMDVERDINAPDRATFDLYCDRVAVAVGRLSVKVFGMDKKSGHLLAHHLGRALQITNILRDIDEDLAIGRLYLPREALDAAGITTSDPLEILADPRVDTVCQSLASEARAHFAAAESIMAKSSARSVRAPRLMAAAYRPLLERLARQGFASPRNRLHISKGKLALSALRIWLAR